MIIVGINAYHGDASAVILADGKLLFAVEEERFTRVKHAAGLPHHALREVLKRTGTPQSKVERIATSRDPGANFLAKLKFVLKAHPPLSFLKSRLGVMVRSTAMMENPALLFRQEGKEWRARGTRVEHHLAHAASTFFPSGFDQAAILTVDGFGDFSSTLFAAGEGNRIKVLKRVLFPDSLGILYTAATQYLGFSSYGDEYKVMGLAAYGEPRFVKEFEQLIHLEPEGLFRLQPEYFVHSRGRMDMTWTGGEPALDDAYSGKWTRLFGPPRDPENPITQRDKDLAASIQVVFEKVLFHLLNHLHEKTQLDTLCLAGGCAFNSLANGKIFDHTPFRHLYIQPAAGDAGTALGSALYVVHQHLSRPRSFIMDHAYWGPEYRDAEMDEVLRERRGDLHREGVSLYKVNGELELCRRAANAIADGKVVGWFQGRMEWGPRALGNRSILADPQRAGMKDILNERIKHRETFRPFAPSVLEEKADEWFHMKCSTSPFMNLVFTVRGDKKSKIPAVTHVDGTARVQTVSKMTNPLFWGLIHEFEKITGVPMVLNTSFNENDPIVCTPADALDCFLRTKMNVLVLGSHWLEREKRGQANFYER